MSKGEKSAFLVIWSQHLSECLPSFGVSWSAEALRNIGTLLTLLRPVNEYLSHLCPKKKKNQFLQTQKNNNNNNKKDQACMLTWAFLPSLGLLGSLCYLVDSRRIITTALREEPCYFMAFGVYFPMYPNLITPVCVCVSGRDKRGYPSCNRLISRSRLSRVTDIVLHPEKADEQRSN